MLAQRTSTPQLSEVPAVTAAVEVATVSCNALIDLAAVSWSDFASLVRQGVSWDSDQDDITSRCEEGQEQDAFRAHERLTYPPSRSLPTSRAFLSRRRNVASRLYATILISDRQSTMPHQAMPAS